MLCNVLTSSERFSDVLWRSQVFLVVLIDSERFSGSLTLVFQLVPWRSGIFS